MSDADKPVRWVGSSLQDLSRFPHGAKRTTGQQLRYVQQGKMPDDYKPMPSIGQGVYEIRVREDALAHRVFYVAKFEEAVYVLHAFQKKTQKTSQHDIDTGKRRYAELLKQRG